MNAAYFYTFPSISAVLIKLAIAWHGRQILKQSSPWIWGYLVSIFVLNGFELVSRAAQDDKAAAFFLLSTYYVAAIVCNISYLAFSLDLAAIRNKFVDSLVYGLLLSALAVVVVPRLAIADVANLGPSLTRVPGSYYWVIQITICSSLFGGTAALFYASRTASDWFTKRRAMAILLGASPTVIGLLLIVLLMQLGYRVNATITISLTINVLLAVFIFTEHEHGLFRFLSMVPGTQEYRLTHRAARAAYQIGPKGLNQAVSSFENALITDALVRCSGNKKRAAELLGISRATLRRKLSDTTTPIPNKGEPQK